MDTSTYSMITPYKLVMLIDDDEPTNFFHEIMIKRTAFSENIQVAQSVSEAIAQLIDNHESERVQPDVIFVDINMPGLDGWDFLHQIQELPFKLVNTKLIMLTTSQNPKDRAKALQFEQVSGYFTKPMNKYILDGIYASLTATED